jgi:hypothetical protein
MTSPSVNPEKLARPARKPTTENSRPTPTTNKPTPLSSDESGHNK